MILNKDNSKLESPIILLFSPPPPQHHLCPFFHTSFLAQPPNSLALHQIFSLSRWWEKITMRRKPRTAFLLSFVAILLFAVCSFLHLSQDAVSRWRPHSDSDYRPRKFNHVVHDILSRQTRRVSSIKDSLSTVSVLLPDWEILVIVSPNTPLSSDDEYHCLFQNGVVSPAKHSGVLPFTNRTTFKCFLPESVRRRRIFSQPVLVTSMSENESPENPPAPELMKWNFLVYESFSTENDVVLFAKGVNHRQGYDRSPTELRCVFHVANGNGNIIRKTVTSSTQEVFRCPHPDPSELGLFGSDSERFGISISLEIVTQNVVVPSVAYYEPRPNILTVQAQPKFFLCACTMVYNVSKFLREWVTYHSKVGVDNFVLYDNGSDDDLYGVINELREEGYNITTLFWIWPKTQEAGFSHSILYTQSKGLCKWMMYVDVDEFVYSPSWVDKNYEDGLHSLKSMLPEEERGIGQVSMMCLEFGPSGQREHPVEGVTQGYTCRRRVEQRHKSVVMVDAVDPSLRNVIHHFRVKEGFESKQMRMEEGLVNHYKYQAWDEFKGKFRRRVSAYVVDWKQNLNPNSRDRTPGLGFEAIEPEDWVNRFCEVRDERLKSLTRDWFGSIMPNGYRMSWQSS